MNSRRDFGTSHIAISAWERKDLKQLSAAEINKVTLKSDDISESEAAGAVRREMLLSSRGCSRSFKVT